MRERITTAMILGALALGILLLSGLPLVMELTASLLAVMAVFELLRTAGTTVSRTGIYVSLGAAALIPLIPLRHYPWLMTLVYPGTLILFAMLMVVLCRGGKLNAPAVTLIGVVIALFARGAVELREEGLWYLLAALAVCVITDSGAFFVGRRLGKHKLAPRISPNKTLEGALGGSLCAVALVMLGAWLFLRDSIVWPKLLCWALTASILAQFGDLSFSTVKRLAGAKDFGTLLPGHGGILDRFDSCLFVLPFTALAVTIGGGFLA